MPRIDTRSPHQLVYRRRFHRAWRLFGCATLLAGSLVASAPWLAPAVDSSPQAIRASVLLGGMAAALGAVLLLGRRVKAFDKDESTLNVWWGVLVPWRQAVYDLPAFHVVLLGPLDAGEASRWQVALGGAEGEFLTVFELPRETAARAAANEIAAFLGWPVALLPAPPPPSPEEGAADEPGDASPKAPLNAEA
ncbi:MAG TPA: hypothetical protein VMV10_08460 [Pirellulales bacterium]|nr:hypothetical protein [Pirellulales bacterium]